MKYSFLKKLTKQLMVCATIISIVGAHNMQAVTTKIKKRPATTAPAVVKPLPKTTTTSATEMEKAHETIKKFKTIITEFFNKSNKEKFSEHVSKLGNIVTDIDALTAETQSKYNATKAPKYKAFLDVLKEIKASAQDIYKALRKKYASVIALAFSLGKVIKKYASSSHVAKLKTKFDTLRKHLNDKEKKVLKNITVALGNIVDGVPKSKVTCLARLNKIWKRK